MYLLMYYFVNAGGLRSLRQSEYARAAIGQKLPFASGSYVSRPEIVVTEKWSRQLDEFTKTGIEAGSSIT